MELLFIMQCSNIMLNIHTAFSQVLSKLKYVFLQSTYTQHFLLKCTLLLHIMSCRLPTEASAPVSRNVLVRVAKQLPQARYARQGKFFVTLVCLPRFCIRDSFLWGYGIFHTSGQYSNACSIKHCCQAC